MKASVFLLLRNVAMFHDQFFSRPSEDDVDLEALVNDMNSSLESLYSSGSGQQTESTPLLHNGQNSCSHHHHTQNNQTRLLHTAQVSPEPPPSSSSPTAEPPHTGLRRSQPMHILAVRLVFDRDVNSSFHFFRLLQQHPPSALLGVYL